MTAIKISIYAFLILVILQLVFNYWRYVRIIRFQSMYEDYLYKPNHQFHEIKHEIVKLFKKAGLEDAKIYFSHMVSPMRVVEGTASFFENIYLLDPQVSSFMSKYFSQAKGVYKSRIRDSINPLYWLETILFLPKHIVEYLGFDGDLKIFR